MNRRNLIGGVLAALAALPGVTARAAAEPEPEPEVDTITIDVSQSYDWRTGLVHTRQGSHVVVLSQHAPIYEYWWDAGAHSWEKRLS